MKSFKVKEGSHKEGKRVYNKGDIVRSERNLVESFPNKFQEVTGTAEDVKAPKAETAKSPKAPQESGSDLGEDVTGEFDNAEDAGLKVFRKGAWHYVADEDKPGTALNDKALKKDAVADFIAEYVEE